jgi:proteic killer suppression protein
MMPKAYRIGESGGPLVGGTKRNPVTVRVTLEAWRLRDSSTKAWNASFTTGIKAGIQAQHADRLRLILGRLSLSSGAHDMNLPGLEMLQLRGSRKGTWAVKVSGNWRITFTCSGKDVNQVDYEDYH